MPGTSSADDLKAHIEELSASRKKSKVRFSDVGVVRSDTKYIQLPDPMSEREAIKHLQKYMDQQSQIVSINIEIDAFPLDGALALAKTLKDVYGWTSLVPTPGFFRDNPPTQVTLECAPGETVQVPWGRMEIPGIAGWIATGAGQKGVHPTFVIGGEVERRHEKVVNAIGDQVRLRLQDESVYRGKAIRLTYRDDDGDRISTHPMHFDPTRTPKFIDTESVREDELIFPEATMRMVQTCLFNPVLHTEACRQHNIPLKRGVMLEGPYGTGKSLSAYVLAKYCVQNGWTYIYIDDVRDLDIAIGVAQMYQPCVVFAEDVNAAVGQTRDDDVNRILNTLDGVSTKNSEIMVVLTTNEVDDIHQAMIRPGRIDTVVEVRAPDQEAAVRLIRLYSRDTISGTDEEIGQAIQPLVDRKATAAVFREVIERARLASVESLQKPSDPIRIEIGHLMVAVESMEWHMHLLKPKDYREPTGMDIFGSAFGRQVSKSITELVNALHNNNSVDYYTERHGVDHHKAAALLSADKD